MEINGNKPRKSLAGPLSKAAAGRHRAQGFRGRLGGVEALWFRRLGGGEAELPRLHLAAKMSFE